MFCITQPLSQSRKLTPVIDHVSTAHSHLRYSLMVVIVCDQASGGGDSMVLWLCKDIFMGSFLKWKKNKYKETVL